MKKITLSIFILLFLSSGCAMTRAGNGMMSHAFQDELEGARQLVKTGQLRQAVDELSSLIDMDPANQEARLLRASAYQRLDEYQPAIQDYEAVLVKDPRSFKAHYNLGMIFAYKLKDTRQALVHLDRYLSLQPRSDQAFAVAKTMCSLDASTRSSLESEGLPTLLKEASTMSDKKEKRVKLEEAAQLNPGSPIPHYLLGKMYEEDGKKDEAIHEYEAAIEIRPTCSSCHLSLGRLLILSKKTVEGQNHVLKSELFDPNGSEAAIGQGDGNRRSEN